MKITLAVSGIAAAMIGAKEIELSLPEGTTYQQIICRLGESYPDLRGIMLNSEGTALLNANVFIANDFVILENRMDDSPQDGERLMLISFIVGG
ncbi:MAG: MoaD/ThiS family protein [Anaerolineaceae bacterium]|nr:MoaD/ThiS family protein [Anaerolineaceae bacterium]